MTGPAGRETGKRRSPAGRSRAAEGDEPGSPGDMGRVAAHVVVESLDSPVLAPDDARHLSSVLRLRPGEPVGVTDGRGGFLPCVYPGDGRLEAVGPPTFAARREPVLTVGFVPVKGDRPEWAVQKLTELGVDRIVLLSAERSVVRWEGSRLVSHLDRLQRVARAALMQSRQVWLPAVSGVVPVESFLAPTGNGGSLDFEAGLPAGVAGGRSGAGCPHGVAVAEMGGGPLGREMHTVLVGPEGGWSDAERDAFGRSTVGVLGLGPAVLRAETAAVAAGVLLTALRAGVVALGP